jgi:hypothetical protein
MDAIALRNSLSRQMANTADLNPTTGCSHKGRLVL